MANPDRIQIVWNAAEAADHVPTELLTARSVEPVILFEALAPQQKRLFVLLGSAAATGEVYLKIKDIDDEIAALRLVDEEAGIDGWYGIAEEPAPVVLFHGDVVYSVSLK